MRKHGVTKDIRNAINDQLKQMIDDIEEMYPSACEECLAIAMTQEMVQLSSERYAHKGESKHAK